MKEQEQEQRRQNELTELVKRGQAMEKDLEEIRKKLVDLQRQIEQLQKRKGNEHQLRGARAKTPDSGWMRHSWIGICNPAFRDATPTVAWLSRSADASAGF